MTLLELLALLRKHLRWLVIVPIACAVVAAAYCYGFMRDVYSTSTTLYVLVSEDTVQSESYSSLSSNFNVSQQIANDVSQLITSARVRSDTAEKLGWPSVAGYGISVSSGEDSRVLRVIVSGRDPEGVAEVANALAEVTSDVAQEVMSVQSVNVLDRAVEPVVPSGPNRNLYVLVAAFGGFFAVCAGIVVADILDTRIRDARTAEEITGITKLGSVPRFGAENKRSQDDSEHRVRAAQDSVKTLLTNLLFLGVDEPIKSIVVTSSVEGEGKSTVACLLAQAIAMSGQSVVLVDCDLRHRTLEGTLGIRAARGIGSVLHGTPIEQVVRPTHQENLFFLNAEADIPNPTEVISSKRFRSMLEMLEGRFSYVVLDAPPLGAFADAAVLSSISDATLLVVREGYTRKAELAAATDQLKKAGAPVVGLALNCGEAGSAGGYYGYGYGYGYGHGRGRRRSDDAGGESVASLAFEGQAGQGAHVRPTTEG